MSPEKIKELMHFYTRAIGLEPRRDDQGFGGKDTNVALHHAVWMCGEVIQFANTQRMAKANRWIGFIQGVLWSHGVMTIDQMRQHNKPEGEAFKGRDEQ
jgi:hypothetical protein